MSWVAVAIGGSAVIGAGAGYLSSKESRKGAEKAAEAQTQAADKAADVQWRMYDTTREDMAPWRETGEKALYSLADLMGLDTGRPAGENTGTLAGRYSLKDFYEDPGYAFRLKEGEKAINRNAAARGDFFSGRTGKALTRYGQDYASNEFGNLFNRYANIAGIGQTTAAQTGQFGQNTAANLGNVWTTTAANVGNAYQNAANARASGYGGIANAATTGMQNYLFYDMMKNPGRYPGLYGG